MHFEDKETELKDGRKCILRAALPQDANHVIEYMKTVYSETPFLSRNADEVTYTEEEEAALFQRNLEDHFGFMMLAEIDGNIAGNCSIMSQGNYRRIRHRCNFAIALKKDFWHLGAASEMITYSLLLAEKMGYEQVELGVIAGNNRAKSLYEKFGFEVTGKNIRALKYDNGSYSDEYIMVRVLL